MQETMPPVVLTDSKSPMDLGDRHVEPGSAPAHTTPQEVLEDLIDEITIDGMCGVY